MKILKGYSKLFMSIIKKIIFLYNGINDLTELVVFRSGSGLRSIENVSCDLQ